MELTEPFEREVQSKISTEKQDDEDTIQKLLIASKEASLEENNIEGYPVKFVVPKKRKRKESMVSSAAANDPMVVIQENEVDENGYNKTSYDVELHISKKLKDAEVIE